MKNIYPIILAAGKGTRMNAVDIPKPMYPIKGKPMVGYTAEMLKTLSSEKPIVVVGFHGQKVIDYLSGIGSYEFVWQHEQLGTGHAVMQAEELLKDKDGIVIVINGDNPFFKKETIERMVTTMEEKNAQMAVSTVELDPSFSFGRVVINANGHIDEIVEVKNATPEQLEIKTMNAGLYGFDNTWLWNVIHDIKRDSVSNEFYVTDLVEIASNKGDKVVAVPVTHTDEAIGINTPQNLQLAEEALEKK